MLICHLTICQLLLQNLLVKPMMMIIHTMIFKLSCPPLKRVLVRVLVRQRHLCRLRSTQNGRNRMVTFLANRICCLFVSLLFLRLNTEFPADH